MALKTAKTNKTDAVMRLLTGKKVAANPILDSSFKEERITQKPASRRANGAEINITGELVTELIPKVLERFNCCTCPLCYADAVAEAGERVPTLKVKINGKEDLKRADKMKKQNRKEVMMMLVSLAVERRKLPKHN